jgi:hypothetical protein
MLPDRVSSSLLVGVLGVLLVAALFSGCAGSEEATGASNAVGVWAYQAESQTESYRGTLTITQAEQGGLRGTIRADGADVGPLELRAVTVQDSTLTLDIEGASAGSMQATATIRDDRLEGTVDVPRYSASLSFFATRQSE